MVTVFSYGYGNGPEWSEQVGVWTWMPSILATQLWSSVAQRMVTFKNSIVLQTKKRSWEKNQESSSGHQDWQKGTRHQRSKEIIDGPSPSNVLYHFFYCNHRIGGKLKEFDEHIYIYVGTQTCIHVNQICFWIILEHQKMVQLCTIPVFCQSSVPNWTIYLDTGEKHLTSYALGI